MPDFRQSREREWLEQPVLNYHNDPSYIPQDQLGGPGMGGAGNESGLSPSHVELLARLEGGLNRSEQLGQESRGLMDALQANYEAQRSQGNGLDVGGMWQGIKNAGSQGMDLLSRGLNAVTPSQDSIDNLAMRFQNAHAIGTGQLPLYMRQQQQQMEMSQQQDLMQMKREQLASQLQQHRQAQQEKHHEQALGIWKDHQMPLAMKKKVSQQLAAQGNVLAGNLARLGDEQLIAEMETLQSFLPKGKMEELHQIMTQPNADLDHVEQWVNHAREKKKVAGEQRMKSERFAELHQRHTSEGLDPMSPEFDEFRQMVMDREKRHKEAAELDLKLQQMGLANKKTQQELALASVMPKEVASGAIGQNQQFTDIFNPQTGKTERITGSKAPLVEVNTGTKASEEAQKRFMDKAAENYDRLRNVPDALANIEEAKKLIPTAKNFMGPAGETLLEVSKFMNNRFGMKIDTAGVKGAEELRSRIFFNIMDNLKKLDAQPSQQQQQVMQDSLGKLGTDPKAMGNILDAYGDSLRRKVDLHNNEIESAEKRNVRFPFEARIKLNPKASPQETEKRSLDDLLKKYGGK